MSVVLAGCTVCILPFIDFSIPSLLIFEVTERTVVEGKV